MCNFIHNMKIYNKHHTYSIILKKKLSNNTAAVERYKDILDTNFFQKRYRIQKL